MTTKDNRITEENGRFLVITPAGDFSMLKNVFELYSQRYKTNDLLVSGLSSGGQIDSLTYLEHDVFASGMGSFFRNPFMGGYNADPAVQESAREKRIERASLNSPNGFLLGIPLLAKLYIRTAARSNVKIHFQSLNLLERMNQSAAAQALSPIYQEVRTADKPENLAGIDYVRLVVSPVQYDNQLVAVPEPLRVEFLVDAQPIVSTDRKEVLERLRLRREDSKLGDIIKGSDGKEHCIGIKTINNKHFLELIPKTRNWFENYHLRVFSG